MSPVVTGVVNVAGRVMIATIFLMSAVGNKIPNFSQVAGFMGTEGVPMPQFLLAGAIVFLIAGSVSVIVGYKARWGAAMLFVFLALATYFFHDFWTMEGAKQQEEMVQFMKNLALMGTMLFLMVNGSGPCSVEKSTPSA